MSFPSFLLIFSLLPVALSNTNINWIQQSRNYPPTQESPQIPSHVPMVRYGHGSAYIGNSLYITHGYRYAHYDPGVGADYLADTWRYDVATGKWSRLTVNSPKPSPRNSLTLVSISTPTTPNFAHGSTEICLFGGDDGGLSGKPKLQSYVQGSFFNDLWCAVVVRDEANVETLVWKEIIPSTDLRLPARAMHTSVSWGGCIVVFGGLIAEKVENGKKKLEDSADVWSFCMKNTGNADEKTGKWVQLWDGRQDVGKEGPTVRHAHSAVVVGDLMVVYGGAAIGKVHYSDTWAFNFTSHKWKLLETRDSPTPRGWHAAVAADGNMFVFGGGVCETGCKLNSELWSLDLTSLRWDLIGDPGPNSRYKHTLVIDHADHAGTPNPKSDFAQKSNQLEGRKSPTRAFLFGGESYKPYSYWNDVWELRIGDGDIQSANEISGDRLMDQPNTRIFIVGVGCWAVWRMFGRRLLRSMNAASDRDSKRQS